jgi:glycine cleavage system H protein
MSGAVEIIDHLLYTKDHEWINIEENAGTIGITDYAQNALGDVTYVELPQEGAEVEQFEQFVSVESVKAASDIFSPMSGRVKEVNRALQDDPGLINKDCYEKGWIAKIEITSPDEASSLMTAEEYRKYLETLEQ